MKRFLFAVTFAALVAANAAAQSDLQPIATVKLQKSEPITIKQVKARVEAYQKELGRPMTLDERKKVLDTMINERLVVQAADRDGVKVSDAEVNQNFLQMISQQVGKQVTELEFAQIVKQQTDMSVDDFMKAQNGMTLAEYKSFLKSQLLAQRYVMAKKQAEIQSAKGPGDADIRSYYELYKKNFVQDDMIRLFLVVSPKGTTVESAAAAKKKVQELHDKLKSDPKSASEIKTLSQVPNSGFQGGDLYVNKNSTASTQLGISMDALLKIFEMNLNEVSDVTETDADYQSFLVMEKFPAKILALSDVIKPGTTVTVYEFIKNNMVAQAQNKAVSDALQQVIADLRKPENFQILKSDADLDKAMSW